MTTDNEIYIPTIGIECHVQLKTKTKLFAAIDNDARDAMPNTLISHICLGMPGALPVLNEKAIYLAIKASFALHTKPQKFSKFDRKHYFYPDLPKGYQITQYEQPIIIGGHVTINVEGKNHIIGITRAHLEEDAGKSTHPVGKNYSLVDLNRAGTPLLEIVSEPEMHSPAQAKAFVKELYLLMKYADVSDCDLYYGNIRFDVNVSVTRDKTLGTRSEFKNLNSFKSVEKAVKYEIDRQIERLKKGERIIQETRGWDDVKQKTFSQRSKEEAHDYRYFPEPDVPPIVLNDKQIHEVEKSMPVLPDKLRETLSKLDLDNSTIETLVENIPAGTFITAIIAKADNIQSRRVANWLVSEVQGLVLKERITWDNAKLDIDAFLQLSKLVENNQVSSTSAKIVLETIVLHGGDPLVIAKEKNIMQVSDESELISIVKEVINDNPKAVQDVKEGEAKAVGFLVGQIMKNSHGKANPKVAQELLKKQIEQ